MKNEIKQIANTIRGMFVLIPGVLITSGLLLLTSFNILIIDSELTLAPFLVITLLTYGDIVLVFLFVSPLNGVLKLLNKWKGSQSQQQLTLKQV